jgi:hypothetical protein
VKEDRNNCHVEEEKARGVYSLKRGAGLYVYDMSRLLESNIVELYKLSRAVVGVNNNIDYCIHQNRISFIESFAKLQMQCLPHRNTINFLGMSQKQDYLIWRAKNGFFSAMDKSG